MLAGRLDKAAREELVEHLEGCAGCRTEVAELECGVERDGSREAVRTRRRKRGQGARFRKCWQRYQAGMEGGGRQPRRARTRQAVARAAGVAGGHGGGTAASRALRRDATFAAGAAAATRRWRS